MWGFFVDKNCVVDIIIAILGVEMNLINKKMELIQQMNIQAFDKKGKQLDAFFIGNKFVELNNARSKSYSLHLNIRRMQKLVLLFHQLTSEQLWTQQ